MPDMYGRGLATGNMIGNMINPASSGREAYLMATKREAHKQELAKNAYGIEEQNGQVIVTPQGQAAYENDPLLMRMAISQYGPVHVKRQQEAMQLGNAKAELLSKAYGLADKLDAQVDSSAGAPEEKLRAKITNGSVVFNMMKDIFGKDMETPFVKMLVQREEVLTNSQLVQNASIGVINSYISEMSEDPSWSPTFQNQERLSVAFKNLSKADQEVYKPTVDRIMAMKPKQISAWEAKMEEFKKEQNFPGEMKRAGQLAGQAAGIQEAKEKRVIDYRVGQEKPQKFQLIGTTDENKPVSYNSTTGKMEVDGQEYVGPVRPRTVNQDVVNRETTSLRKEFNALPEIKNFTETSRQYEIMGEAMKKGLTAGNKVAVDQALINLYNKMMDPTSVVRESEYARTASDLALLNRVKGLASKIASGGAGLTKDDRQAIYDMAGKFKEASERKYKQRLHEYKGYMSNYGVDPNKYLNPASGEKTVVETRVTKDGKKLVKYSDGTIEEQ